VERVKKLLLAQGYDAAAIKAIEKGVKKEVDAAVEDSKVRGEWVGGGWGQGGGCVCVGVCVWWFTPASAGAVFRRPAPTTHPASRHCCCCRHQHTQAASPPSDAWLWRNVYVNNDNVALRDVEGHLVHPTYDRSYAD
jgi:hypothetical protein